MSAGKFSKRRHFLEDRRHEALIPSGSIRPPIADLLGQIELCAAQKLA